MRGIVAWGAAWGLAGWLGACEPAPEGGTIAVGVTFRGQFGATGLAPTGTVVLRTASGERSFDLADGLFGGDYLTIDVIGLWLDDGPRPAAAGSGLTGARTGLPCHPDDGPVEIVVRWETARVQRGEGPVTWAPQLEQRATATCRAGWEQGVAVGFESHAPDRAGTWRVRVVLEGAPDGAVGGVAVLGFARPMGLVPERVALARDGEVLAGVWEGWCEGAGTREVTIDVGAIEVPGWSEAEVWAAWPPPARATATVECVVGEEREVEVVLGPRGE